MRSSHIVILNVYMYVCNDIYIYIYVRMINKQFHPGWLYAEPNLNSRRYHHILQHESPPCKLQNVITIFVLDMFKFEERSALCPRMFVTFSSTCISQSSSHRTRALRLAEQRIEAGNQIWKR